MYKFDIRKRERRNFWLLSQYLLNYSPLLAFVSFADGVCKRLKLNNLYKYTSRMRADVCKRYLREHYSDIITKYHNGLVDVEKTTIDPNSNVWTMWWQGSHELPTPVAQCIESMKKRFKNRQVIIIDKYNYSDYIDIPQYITEKVRTGNITIAHLSDYIRITLLEKYGGIWVDSTLFVSSDVSDELTKFSFYSINHGGG